MNNQNSNNNAPEKSERRKSHRVLKNIKVSYTVIPIDTNVTPYEFGKTITTNIGRYGFCMFVSEKVPEQSLIQIALKFANLKYSIQMLGKVIWSEWYEKDKMYQVGIKFVGLLPENWEKIISGE